MDGHLPIVGVVGQYLEFGVRDIPCLLRGALLENFAILVCVFNLVLAVRE